MFIEYTYLYHEELQQIERAAAREPAARRLKLLESS